MQTGPFEDFYANGYAQVVAAVGLVTGSREDAQDAVDEALARAWAATRRHRAPDELGAWVRVVALNIARGGLRRRGVDSRARARLATGARSESDPVGTAIDVRRALARLTRRQREVTVLHYFADLSVQSIADELHVDVGTVKTLLHRARHTLAEVLTEAPEVDRA